jgi:hypothetical protein
MKPTEPMTLTKDAVTKLALPPGKTEHTVWDHAIAGFGIRLREHSATYFFRYRHGKRQPRITIGAVSAITNAKARAKAAELYARAKLAEDPAGARCRLRAEHFRNGLFPVLGEIPQQRANHRLAQLVTRAAHSSGRVACGQAF